MQQSVSGHSYPLTMEAVELSPGPLYFQLFCCACLNSLPVGMSVLTTQNNAC
jgi:hypothetical protein